MATARAPHYRVGIAMRRVPGVLQGTDRSDDHAVGVDTGRPAASGPRGGRRVSETKSYDAKEFQDVDRQKCLGHILRNLAEVVEAQHGRAREFGVVTKSLLQESMELWRARHSSIADEFTDKAKEVKDLVSYHLRDRTLTDEDNQRLLNGLGAHDDRGHPMRFLETPFTEPTNNRAERILRPAVIARKVSQCSKTQQGAEEFAAFKSIAQTAVKNGAASITSVFRVLFTAPHETPSEHSSP